MSEPVRNFNKPFGIAGFIVGELIMLYTVLAPNMKGLPAPPADALVMRVLVGAIFFGPFGMAAGTGVGMLVTGLAGLGARKRGRGGEGEKQEVPTGDEAAKRG